MVKISLENLTRRIGLRCREETAGRESAERQKTGWLGGGVFVRGRESFVDTYLEREKRRLEQKGQRRS